MLVPIGLASSVGCLRVTARPGLVRRLSTRLGNSLGLKLASTYYCSLNKCAAPTICYISRFIKR